MKELKKILYVEDEQDIQVVANLALESLGGFELLLCSNGQEAVDKAVDFMPDLFLFDVMMPGMDGPSAYKILHEMDELKTIPVIFMTAKVQPEEIQSYRALGAIDVISKPFDTMLLADQVKEIWAKQFD